jgi:hypothetical protein
VSGGAADRHGEPFGELGLVTPRDKQFWQDQTGAPHDPQAGNHAGRRDVLRYEDFSSTADALSAWAVASGTWVVRNSRYESVAVSGQDAVSLFYVDHVLPSYYELFATVSADKPTGGQNANAYIIFDYQSATDFKFAGIDVGTNKLQIGRRTASGWQVLAQANLTLTAGRDYDLFVVVDGQTVTLTVEGVSVSYTFSSPLLDPTDPSLGVADPLTDGAVGIGSNASIGRVTRYGVQVPAPEITYSATQMLNAPPGHQVVSGTWSVEDGRYTGTATTAAGAISLAAPLEVAPSSLLVIDTTVRTTSSGGLVFDYLAPDRFKYVVLDATAGRLVIGHRTAKGWVEDAVLSVTIVPGADYILSVRLVDNRVTVALNGTDLLSYTYNSLVNQGPVGLLSRAGATSFASLTHQTDDPDLQSAVPSLTVRPATVVEGDSGSRTVQVTVQLSRASTETITVSYTTADGTAHAGSDYQSAQGTLTFAPGELSKTISVTVYGDTDPEADEVFWVILSEPVGATLATAAAPVTILNDDASTTVNVVATDPDASEVGPETGTFAISRDGALDAPFAVRLDWSGTAVRNLHFTVSVTGGTLTTDGSTLTLDAGAAVATITIHPIPDDQANATRTVILSIVHQETYRIGDAGSATVRIHDDVSAPRLSISSTTVVEGNVWAQLVITLSAPAPTSVTVTVRTYDGTAKAGQDYRSLVTTITFEPGQTTAIVEIRIIGDSTPEPDEYFTVELSDPVGAVIDGGVGMVTITERKPLISVVATTATANEVGPVSAVFTVTRSVSLDVPVTIALTWGGTATFGSDYTITVVGGTLSADRQALYLAGGVTTATITITPLPDTLVEGDETVILTLNNSPSYDLATARSATITILDAPPPPPAPVVSITAPVASTTEGSTTPAQLVLTRTGDLTSPLTVNLSWNGTATASVDYTWTVTGGTLAADRATATFSAGSSSITITIHPIDDAEVESNESVIVGVVAGSGYDVGTPASATVTIIDNDAPPPPVLPTVSIDDITVIEGDRGTSNAVLTISLSAPATTDITVRVTTVDGTAKAKTDYRALTTTITIKKGATTATVTIQIVGDKVAEPTEYFTVVLSNLTGEATLDKAVGTVTIIDNDGKMLTTSLPEQPVSDDEALTAEQLQPLFEAAIAAWAARGADPTVLAALTFEITDLEWTGLAETVGTTISLDATAAGWGWYVDPTPGTHDGFVRRGGVLVASAGSAAAGRLDLWSVLLHEIGHALGYGHDTFAPGSDLGRIMDGVLEPGVRRSFLGRPDRWRGLALDGRRVACLPSMRRGAAIIAIRGR